MVIGAPRAVDQLEATEDDAALAWLEAADPDAHAQYLQMQATATEHEKTTEAAQMLRQYRTHTAAEAEAEDVEDLDAQPVDADAVAAADIDLAEPTTQEATATALDEPRPYEDLPDQVLAEEAAQVAAEYADAERVATNAVANLATLQPGRAGPGP